jgi:hypothetical protein
MIACSSARSHTLIHPSSVCLQQTASTAALLQPPHARSGDARAACRSRTLGGNAAASPVPAGVNTTTLGKHKEATATPPPPHSHTCTGVAGRYASPAPRNTMGCDVDAGTDWVPGTGALLCTAPASAKNLPACARDHALQHGALARYATLTKRERETGGSALRSHSNDLSPAAALSGLRAATRRRRQGAACVLTQPPKRERTHTRHVHTGLHTQG